MKISIHDLLQQSDRIILSKLQNSANEIGN